MLTMPGRSGHRVLALFSVLLLSACSARPVLHEFPPPLAPDARPEAAVSYTLRQLEPDSDKWILRGAAGEQVGEFRWKPAFREVVETASPDRSEDFRRNDLIQDGVNHTDYIFRVSATSGSLSRSSSLGTAPPRATIFAAATGQRVGELEIRGGYDMRFEGDWNGRQILWRMDTIPEGQLEGESDDGAVLDTYPAAQRLQWTGGSSAGLIIYSGRAVRGEPEAFAEPVFDIEAGRALTRRELGDAVVMLFAIRAAQEAAVLVNAGG